MERREDRTPHAPPDRAATDRAAADRAAADRVRVLVIDDHSFLRDLIRLALELDGSFEVVGEGETGADAIVLADALRPDAVILDGTMPEVDGLSAIPEIASRAPETKIVVYSPDVEGDAEAAAYGRGADYVIERTTGAQDLLVALKALCHGEERGWALTLVEGEGEGIASPAPFSVYPVHGVNVREQDGRAIGLVLSGALREGDITTLAEALEPLLRDAVATVVLDLSELELIEAAGLGAIVRAARRLQLSGRELIVRSPRPATYQAFEDIGLTDILTVVA
ncbi:MAG TPA: response regulator [Acidimicrobiales bacterium]|nr:response regulator [Acidimicrobiales bacterium]